MNERPLSERYLPPVWLMQLVLVLLGVVAYQVIALGASPIDAPVYTLVSGLHDPVLTEAVAAFTNVGGDGLLIVICLVTAAVLWRVWGWKCGALCVGNLFLLSGLNTLIKILVRRPRPAGAALIEQGGFSFPSGHSACSMAFYGFLIILLLTRLKGKGRFWAAGILGTLIFFVGLSRIYLGVHYASDVAAGFMEGFLWLGVVLRLPPFNRILTGDSK